MQVSSPAFTQDGAIPRKFTGDGDDVSPALEWRDVPDGTKSFLLLCEDPDAPSGTFRHWAAWNIPADWRRLDEAAATQSQAVNDFGKVGYGGPMPPKGDPAHHYHFRVAALDCARLPVGNAAKITEVLKAARPHILGEGEVVGLYGRSA